MAVLFLEDQEFLRVEQAREHRRFTGADGIDRQTIFLRSSSGQASLLNMKFSLRSKWIFLYFGAMERSVYKASFVELNRQRMGRVSMRRGKSMISILMRKECWVNFSLLRMNRTTGIMPNLPKSPCSSRPIRRNAST